MSDHSARRFNWGRVIERFTYDFDGQTLLVIKYHPWRATAGGTRWMAGDPDLSLVEYTCDELNVASDNLFEIVLHWITYKQLGRDQDCLVDGLARALCLRNKP